MVIKAVRLCIKGIGEFFRRIEAVKNRITLYCYSQNLCGIPPVKLRINTVVKFAYLYGNLIEKALLSLATKTEINN